MLGPLFPGRLVVGEGTEPLLVAADVLDEVSVLILAANHKVLNHQSHASHPGEASVTSLRRCTRFCALAAKIPIAIRARVTGMYRRMTALQFTRTSVV